MARSLVLVFSLISSAQSYTTSQPNCTAPTTSVNFFSSSETRGTLDILWSCLFTIFACTWTVQHLNVPEQREDRDQGWRRDIKWALKRTLTSAKWMLATAIAPEVLIAKGWGDIVVINENHKKLSSFAQQDKVPWSRTHTLFANMGGFVIRSHVPERVKRLNETNSGMPTASDQSIELEEILTRQRTEAIENDSQPSKNNINMLDAETQLGMSPSNYSNPYHLLASDVATLREADIIQRLPYITLSELGDKSKSDGFVRLIAVTQIFWITIQIVVRAYRQLAIAQLEIAVIAFAICAIVIYGLNWEKPKGVQTPYTILQYHSDIPSTVISLVGDWATTSNSPVFEFSEMLKKLFPFKISFIGKTVRSGPPIRNHFVPSQANPKLEVTQIAGLVIGGVAFGAIHLIAQDFTFHTLIEKKFWLASSIYATSSPLVISLVKLVGELLEEAKSFFWKVLSRLLYIMSSFMIVLHVIARSFLLIEIFRTLCFLPPSAYIATWAANVPHIT